MAADSNTGFQSGVLMSDYYSQFGMNFNVNNSGVAVGGGMFSNPTNNNLCSSNNSPRISQYGSCSGPFLIDNVPGLKHDTGLASEWTVEEQYKLDEGLIKFAKEPRILKYIKIAATLRDKNVRDVALRCRWMTRKRRKQEDYSLGKKLKDRKGQNQLRLLGVRVRDKSAEMSLKSTVPAALTSLTPYCLSTNHRDNSDVFSSGALLGTRRLLEENNQALNKISANLSTLELQDNVDLFLQTKNNLTAILNDMRTMPGLMSQMSPLPVFLNEELVSSLWHNSSQPMKFGCKSGIPLKQEPAC